MYVSVLTIFVLLLFALFVSFQMYKKNLKFKELQITELLKQVKQLRDHIKSVNKRRGYRLEIGDKECAFQEEQSLKNLKDRKGTGKSKILV